MAEEKKEQNELSKEQILESLGFSKDISLDQFKESMTKDWLRRDNLYKDEKVKTDLQGWVFNLAQQDARKQLKSTLGVEVAKDEAKTIEELFSLGLERGKDRYEKELTTLKDQISTDSSKVYQEENERLRKELQIKDEKITNIHSEYEKAQQERLAEDQKREKHAYMNRLKSTIQYSSAVKEIEKIGFEAYFNNKYSVQKDTTGTYIAVDSEGKQIENPKVIGKFLTPEELIKKEAIDKGIVKTNPNPAESKDYKPETKKVEVKTTPDVPFFTKPVGYNMK